MNDNNIIGRVYAQKVELLLRLMPIVMEEGMFEFTVAPPSTSS